MIRSPSLKASFDSALAILQLKEPAIHAVSQDKEALRPALLFVAIGALVSTLGLAFFPTHMGMIVYRPDLLTLLGAFIGATVMQVLGLALVAFVAEKLFGSKISVQGFVQVMGHASILNVLGVIPGLGALASLWSLVVLGKVLTTEGKMQVAEIVILLVVLLVLFSVASYYSFLGGFVL